MVATTVEAERGGGKVVVEKTMFGGVIVSEKMWDSCAGTSVIRLTEDGDGALDIRIVVSNGKGTGGDGSCEVSTTDEVCGIDKALVNGVLDGMLEMA